MSVTNTTPLKLSKAAARQRFLESDFEALTSLNAQHDEIYAYNLLSELAAVVYGFHVTHNTAKTFNVSNGAAIRGGELLKSAGTLVTPSLDDGDATHPRIDLIELTGSTTDDSDSVSRVLLGAISRTNVADEAVGVGDGSQKIFDLGNSRIDLRTLKIYIEGEPVGGWNLLPGTGTAGVDQVVFGVAPANGDAIDVDYTYQTGGNESSSTVATRKTRRPSLNVVKGTPASSPSAPSQTSGSVLLARVTVPAGWTGGSGGLTIANNVKTFLVGADTNVDAAAAGEARIATALRGCDQVVHGCRLRWNAWDDLRVTPGWGVWGGVAWALTSELRLTDTPAATGWHYVYLVPDASGTPSLKISTAPPSSRRREPNERAVYVGAVFVVDDDPLTYRPFFTHGDWVFYPGQIEDDAGGLEFALTLASFNSPAELNLAPAIPATGRLAQVRIQSDVAIGFEGTLGYGTELRVYSHRPDGSSVYGAFGITHQGPMFTANNFPTLLSNTALREMVQGIVRAEVDSAARKISYSYIAGVLHSYDAKLIVEGYLDDYRTLDGSGTQSDY